MLSILIPTYNAVCLPLVEALHRQALRLGLPFEILLADDASCASIQLQNRSVESLEQCRYLPLPHNVGPARIRNYLAAQSRYDLLLFLDSDTLPVRETFLEEYLASALESGVVCGGFVYPRQEVLPSYALRYRYGILVEEMSASQRNRHPYQRFIGMSFLASRRVFDAIEFDPTMHFGYEDASFGRRLEEACIPVSHIDNPVYHLNTDTSEAYLCKIRRSVENLSNHTSQLEPYVRLLQWYAVLRRFRVVSLVAVLFRLTEKGLIRNLTSPTPSMRCFALYKLGYLCTLLS